MILWSLWVHEAGFCVTLMWTMTLCARWVCKEREKKSHMRGNLKAGVRIDIRIERVKVSTTFGRGRGILSTGWSE